MKRRRREGQLFRLVTGGLVVEPRAGGHDGPSGPEDVIVLVLTGEWEHGQTQRLQVPLAVENIDPFCQALQASKSDLTHPASVQPPAPPREPAGDVGDRGRLPVPHPAPDTRPAVAQMLDQRAARVFDGRPRAHAAWLAAAMRKAEVDDPDDLPVSVMAELFNGLAAHERAQSGARH